MLKKAIMKNAIFSGVSGLVILLNSDWFLIQLPAPDWLMTAIAVGLLIFSLQLLLMTRVNALAERLILQVIFSDLAWVLITFIALVAFHEHFSSIGVGLVLFINMIVTSLIWLQFSAYKRNKLQTVS